MEWDVCRNEHECYVCPNGKSLKLEARRRKIGNNLYRRYEADEIAESGFRIHLYGMRFFYELMLRRRWSVFDLIRPRKSQTLPVVLSPQEGRSLLALVNNPTARMCLQMIHACGLRLREETHLQVSDIDPQPWCPSRLSRSSFAA
jgi:site-specific recombinase XerD